MQPILPSGIFIQDSFISLHCPRHQHFQLGASPTPSHSRTLHVRYLALNDRLSTTKLHWSLALHRIIDPPPDFLSTSLFRQRALFRTRNVASAYIPILQVRPQRMSFSRSIAQSTTGTRRQKRKLNSTTVAATRAVTIGYRIGR